MTWTWWMPARSRLGMVSLLGAYWVFGSIVDFAVLVGLKLGLRGHGVSVLGEEVPDVIFHREEASAFCIVPF